MIHQGRKSHNHFRWYRLPQCRRAMRAAAERIEYDGYGFHYRWVPRWEDVVVRVYWGDDFGGSNSSSGWKHRRARHQWEHNVVTREKHEKSRRRKALKRLLL